MAVVNGWDVVWPSHVTESELDPDKKALAEEQAVASLRMLTGYRVGGIPVEVMPHKGHERHHGVVGTGGGVPFHPVLNEDGSYSNCWCGSGCPTEERVRLDVPVGRIDEVRLNDTVVDPSAYYVVSPGWLTRIDGGGWPTCPSLKFTVKYLNAYPVSRLGKAAAGVLAHEFYKLLDNDKRCALPKSVRSLSRQGVSIEIEAGMFPEGVTGINQVDVFIRQWNPDGLRHQPAVYSPDLNRPKRVTIKPGGASA